MRFPVTLLSVIIVCGSAQAQWQIQNSRTTASLRGIHALSSEVAWASGTSGTKRAELTYNPVSRALRQPLVREANYTAMWLVLLSVSALFEC
ncbi:hypothetical protein [Edaphobacter aggregans]|nr:hypothetical protein [Edaphobacter aggregans]